MQTNQIDYAYGYCGMPCALCSRYHTNGISRCPGCSHDGYYTDPCKVHHCCREKELAHCGQCDTFPCERLGKMSDFSDLNTNHVKQRTGQTIREQGFDKWYAAYAERVELLAYAMEHYNDGRMKRYLCELFIQQDQEILKKIMSYAERITANTSKEAGKEFKKIVNEVLERNQ